MYRIDFAHNFFTSLEAEQAEFANYHATLGELESFRGQVIASADSLLQALRLYDQTQVEFMRHYTYHYLRYAVNTADVHSKALYSRMGAEFAERTAFIRMELMGIDLPMLDRFIAQESGLGIYRFAVESVRRYRPYTLSLEEESVINGLAPFTSEWEYDLYGTLLQQTHFGKLITANGELDVFGQRAAIANHPDSAIRQAGFKQLYAGYASQRDLYAFSFINLARARNRLARLHRFEDAASEIYFNSFWTKAEVTSLLEQIAGQAQVYQRYQSLRLGYARKKLGLQDVQVWDMPAFLSAGASPRFTIEQASSIIRDALAPLGAEYGNELARLLDPANGRMDILPGDHRRPGGFSKGFPGVTTVFFSQGFEGYYNDLRVLVHESTHAVHRQLMSNHHVLPIYADGPHYLFESFAIFNELLLPDYLYRSETDPDRKRYFLEQFFDSKGMALFFIAQDALLEQAIYEEVEGGKLNSADDLDALAKRVIGRFDIWIERHAELKMRWITNRLFFEDPFYDVNYVYGSLLALKYLEMYMRSPEPFIKHYIALMGNGFNAPPEVLLREFLGIDLHDPKLVEDAVRLLNSRVNQLEREYLRE